MHPLKAAYRFTLHTVAGAAMFAVVGAAAVALNYCAILIAKAGVSPYIVLGIQSLEFFLFLADSICLVFFITREALDIHQAGARQRDMSTWTVRQTLRDVAAGLKYETAESIRLYFLPLRVLARALYRSVREATDPPTSTKAAAHPSEAPKHHA